MREVWLVSGLVVYREIAGVKMKREYREFINANK